MTVIVKENKHGRWVTSAVGMPSPEAARQYLQKIAEQRTAENWDVELSSRELFVFNPGMVREQYYTV
jgi:hypothetical protein